MIICIFSHCSFHPQSYFGCIVSALVSIEYTFAMLLFLLFFNDLNGECNCKKWWAVDNARWHSYVMCFFGNETIDNRITNKKRWTIFDVENNGQHRWKQKKTIHCKPTSAKQNYHGVCNTYQWSWTFTYFHVLVQHIIHTCYLLCCHERLSITSCFTFWWYCLWSWITCMLCTITHWQ